MIKEKIIQTQVINYLLDKNDLSFLTLNDITEKYFATYKDEYNFIVNHYELYGKVPDKATFLQTFPKFTLFDVTEPESYLVDELYRDYKTRQIAYSFNNVKDKIMSNDLDGALAIFEKSYDSISTIGEPMKCVDITKDTSRYDAYIDRVNDFDKYYISTGFKELDAIVGGFDREEELAGIVARPNVGKSWILLYMAMSAAKQGLNVGFYSGEMSDRKVGYRFDTLFGNMNNGGITHGNEKYKLEYKKYMEELPNDIKGSLKVITPEMIGGFATVNKIRTFIEKEKLDIMFIDQLSLMEDVHKAIKLNEQQSNIIKDLKKLVVTIKKSIIFACQQNRADDEAGKDTRQVAGSDDISRFATMLLFLGRKDDTLTLDLIKSRDSENFKKLNYVIDLNVGKFTYVPGEDEIVADDDSGESYEDRYKPVDATGDDVF